MLFGFESREPSRVNPGTINSHLRAHDSGFGGEGIRTVGRVPFGNQQNRSEYGYSVATRSS